MKRSYRRLPAHIAWLILPGMLALNPVVQADATLVYRTSTDKDDSARHTFAISGRFVRVDKDTEPDRYWIIDAGLLTLADVDVAGQRYTFRKLPRGSRTETGPDAAGGQAVPRLSPQPVLAPTREKRNVAQVLCREVREMRDGIPVAVHCMAGTGPLGMTSREMVTLSRLFTLARRMDLGWAGVATSDERIASIESRLQDGTSTQVLESISYDPIPDARMQVPKRYRHVATPEEEGGKQEATGAGGAPAAPGQTGAGQAAPAEASPGPNAPAGG